MADGIKISEFELIEELQEGCCLPTISNGENRRITYGALRNQLVNELQAAGISGAMDITNLVSWNSKVRDQSLYAVVDRNKHVCSLFVTCNVPMDDDITIFSGLPYLTLMSGVHNPVRSTVSTDLYYIIGSKGPSPSVYEGLKFNLKGGTLSKTWCNWAIRADISLCLSYMYTEE